MLTLIRYFCTTAFKMKTKIDFKKLQNADLFINSSAIQTSQEDDRAFSEFLKNKKKSIHLNNIR